MKKKVSMWPVATALAALTVAGCPNGTQLDSTPEDGLYGLELGCPHSWDSVTVVVDHKTIRVGIELRRVAAAPGTQGTYDLPEANDCQRFLAQDDQLGSPFGSVFAVFVEDPAGFLDRLDANDRAATIVAQVWTYQGTYAPLNIEPGFSCVYLWGRESAWQGALIHSGVEQECATSMRPGGIEPGDLLNVVETIPGDRVRPEDYPLSARWEWDPEGQLYRIGIRCGVAWCELTKANDPVPVDEALRLASGSVGLVGAWTGDQATRALVKGWYDEQVLDVFHDGSLISSGVRGFVVPDLKIGHALYQDYEDNWIRSAYAFLNDGAPEQYRKKLNFGTTDWLNPNVIEFCRAGPDFCRVPESRRVELDCKPSNGPAGTDPAIWYSQITNAETSQIGHFCVIHHDHGDLEIPPAARWRGVENDAMVWTRCAQGCCTVE